MATLDIEFEWTRGFQYELVGSGRSRVIRQRGAGQEAFKPLAKIDDLDLRFAKLDGSPESFLQFASAYGLLRTEAHNGAEESAEEWRHEHDFVRKWLRLLDIENAGKNAFGRTRRLVTGEIRRTYLDLADLKARLISSELGDPRPFKLLLQPKELRDAIRLQFAQRAASGNGIATCQQCGTWFEVGAAGKRSVSKFCSAKCRNRFHYEARAK